MLNLLIWSKDRACQLDLLLQSLPAGLFNLAYVVYKTSTKEYQDGYCKLLDQNFDTNLELKPETDFQKDTTEFIRHTANAGNMLCVSTDDTVFFADCPISSERICNLLEDKRTATFSFRYGFNTIVQNCHNGEIQPHLDYHEDEGDHIVWNSLHYHPLSNYGYPFGLDAHCYDPELLHTLS